MILDSLAVRGRFPLRSQSLGTMQAGTILSGAMLVGWLLVGALPAIAATTDCATSWDNFKNNPGFIAEYTSGGFSIADHETSSDPTNGGTGVQPKTVDLSSGSSTGDPGAFTTPFFGYYNGGTPYDPSDPSTADDDYIFFRMRVEADPSFKAGFDSNHWNVLLDVDNDGYKEYWIDLDGTFTQGNTSPDRLQVLFDNANRQDIDDPDAVRVDLFSAFSAPDNDVTCPASSPGLSHTRVVPADDGVDGDSWVEVQVPMSALDDLNGNQVVFPDSPVAFVFSTSASNQNPLQKDFMSDLDFTGLSDPITFGDVVIPNGRPQIAFTDSGGGDASFYVVGDEIFIEVVDRFANTDPDLAECITVTVTNPAVGDDETVTLCETGPNSGTFTNQGGACGAVITNPSPAPSPPTAWVAGGIQTSGTTLEEDWTLTFGGTTWSVTGTVSGLQAATVTAGTPYVSDGGEIAFTLYEDSPTVGTTLEFCTRAADPLSSSSTAGLDDDGDLQVFSGDEITVSYTNGNSLTVTDTADIVAPCEAFIQFTRSNGLPSDNFELGTTAATSDELFVSVFLREANTDPLAAETIQVTLTGNDSETLTLTETGVDTGEFRNVTGFATKIDDGVVTPGDDLWEDVDGGVVTATYSYTCLGNNFSVSTTADLFFIDAGGRVRFTNGAGTQDVEIYGASTPVFLEVKDPNACTTLVNGVATLQVTVTSASGDSETVTLYETAPGSGVFRNSRGDLVTTAASAIVTSASATFVSDGVLAGDDFVIAEGPDAGTYTVASVDSETQITLTQTLTTSRVNIAFKPDPLIASTFDGASVANDGLLEAAHDDELTVSYGDCDDGDLDATNNTKIDLARYNAPPLLLNAILYEPDASTNCQTESIEIVNTSSQAVTATGFSVGDQDGFSYTVPQFGGSNLVLQPGERIFLSLYTTLAVPPDFFDTSTYYLFTGTGTTFPTNALEGNSDAGPADQVVLFDGSGVIQDYIGWSANLSPSLDFLGDDSPAVLRSLWQDDAFRNVAALATGQPIRRQPSGFDTNVPADWQIAAADTTDCAFVISRADVAELAAFDLGGRTVVRFETTSEAGTVAFRLERRDAGGVFRPVLPDVVPSVMAPQGGIYHVVDSFAPAGEPLTYRLVETESQPGRNPWLASRERRHGPFTVDIVPAPAELAFDPSGGDVQINPHTVPARETARLAAHRDEHAAARGRRFTRVGTRIEVTVREDGLHRVDAADLAPLFDLPEKTIEAWLRGARLELTHRGRAVAWTPTADGHGLLFWGEAIDSPFTDENVYVLEKGDGTLMAEVSGALAGSDAGAPGRGGRPGEDPPAVAEAPSSFPETLHFEGASTPAPTFFTDPEADFWFWDFLIGGNPVFGQKSYTFDAPGATGDGTARLDLAFHGGSATATRDEHHLRIRVNGALIGDVVGQGVLPFAAGLALDPALLEPSGNVLEIEALRDPGVPFSVVFFDAFDLTYARRYEALDGALTAPAQGADAIAVDGFTEPEVLVVDVTAPRRPRLVTGVTVDATANGHRASFAAAELSPDARFIAVAAAGVRRPRAITVDVPSELLAGFRRGELVVIAPDELLDGAEALAEYRRAQGLSVVVASLEDVVDEVAAGIFDPRAIGDFLAEAHARWSEPPRYALLVGHGTIDYLDHQGLGGNPMPPVLVATSSGLFTGDTVLGDVDRDGLAEIAVGRLPVLTAAEMAAYLDKVRAFEAAAGSPWRDRTLLVADNDDGRDDDLFARDLASMSAFLGAAGGETLLLGRDGFAAVRSGILGGFKDGMGWLNYVGHGGLDRLAGEGVFLKWDVPALQNAERPALVTAFSCLTNRYALPGFPSLGADLVASSTGGAVAVWAPSALSRDDDATVLGQGFFRAMTSGGELRLGDAILRAGEEYTVRERWAEMLEVYILLGDPTLLVGGL